MGLGTAAGDEAFDLFLRTTTGALPIIKRLAPAIADNWFTRTLLGRSYLCSKFGRLQQQHLQLAQAQLLEFDVLLVLEDGAAADVAIR